MCKEYSSVNQEIGFPGYSRSYSHDLADLVDRLSSYLFSITGMVIVRISNVIELALLLMLPTIGSNHAEYSAEFAQRNLR